VFIAPVAAGDGVNTLPVTPFQGLVDSRRDQVVALATLWRVVGHFHRPQMLDHFALDRKTLEVAMSANGMDRLLPQRG
jgi:hypothetical protein